MRKLLSWFLGVGIGGVLASIAVLLFAPASGKDLRRGMRAHYENAVEIGRQAAVERRAELERQLTEMKQPSVKA
jgi:gas vesicle protein